MADDHDPIVLYIVVREELLMSNGKCAAQCAHAVQHILMKYFKIQILHAALKHKPEACAKVFHQEDDEHIKITSEWIDHASRKVVLKADDKEWEKLKAEFGDSIVVIKDAGYTEVPSGSETCIAFWPQHKSQVSKTIKRLQVL
jgi:peptidyl-tRNA hydrolase